MLQAMNTGHDGSLTTVHAGSPAEALRRIETMVLMAGLDLPHAAVREQVPAAIDLVVHVSRGGRRPAVPSGRGGPRSRVGELICGRSPERLCAALVEQRCS